MKFSEIPYKRPDLKAMKDSIAADTKALRAAKSYAEAREVFLKHEKESGHRETLATLVSIRSSVNTKDEFYDAERKFWNDAGPELQEYSQMWLEGMLKSPFRADFEKEYGSILFLNAEIEKRSFSPAIVEEMQKENDWNRKYKKLIASAQIPFRGGVYTISQLAPFKTDPDDRVRLEAWKAEGKWYKDHQKDLDEIYDTLVKLRDGMGKKLGYENYLPLGYDRMVRNCYTKEDVEAFRGAVVKYLVPVADSIYRAQAKRLGKEYPMNFADNALTFRSGNARPAGGEKEILAAAKKFYDELSPETSVFFRAMLEGEWMDLLSKEGKEGGGYCTSLYDYKMPFIFANFNGTRDDVETVTHEAGHAFAGWYNRDRIPIDTAWPSLEGCEVHSMSMEFFSWPWAEGFFGKDTKKFLYSHLAGSVTFIPYGTMVDHFQHSVYENPEWTPRQRHAEWKRLLGIYMPWVRLDGEIPFYSEGEGWQRQHHIYTRPFYYIDYCLAQTVALEFWAKIMEDVKSAWKTYMAYTSQGGSVPFTELLKNARLGSPFDPETLAGVCKKAAKWLEDFDLTGIE